MVKWNYDLSRRWLLFKLNKFSFREYLLLNYSSIAKTIQTTPDTIKNYINILSEIWFLNVLWKQWKISINLRKTKKVYFELTNFLELFSDEINTNNLVWIRRESFVVSELWKIWKLYYPEKSDLLFINSRKKYYFEIWWKSKKYKQIKWLENAFLIKDWIEIWEDLQIPIYLFWFLY